MKKILLLCAAGLSTSMVVEKMNKAAKEQNIEVLVEAHAVEKFEELLPQFDIVLLGPQVKFKQDELQGKAGDKKVEIINMADYGTMNGAKILNDTLALIS